MNTIFSRVVGDAGSPWLVVCHGMALSHDDLAGFAGLAAARGWRVLLWDMPGHGGSAPPREWSLGAMTDAFEGVLAAHGVERPVVFGFSFGGIVAQEWLRRHPGAAAGLIAYGCLAPFSQPAPVPRWLAGPVIRITYGPRAWDRIRADFARFCAVTDVGRRAVDASVAALGKPAFMAMSRALLRAFGSAPGFAIDCPLLLVRGDRDANAALLDRADAGLLALRPNATRARVAGAGHCAHLDQPRLFAEAVWPFLDAVRPTAAASRPATG